MTLIIAHRGASADAPENTLSAFRLAWEQEADGIEGDFRLSSDGRIVCIHDEDAARVAGTSLIVEDTPLAKLRTLDIGAWKGESWRGERIATLDEVLAIVPEGKQLVLELKAGPEIVEPLVDVLERTPTTDENLLLISLVDATVAECKRRLPNVRCHWLTGYHQQSNGTWTPTADEVIATIRRLGADGFGSESKPEHFDADFVERLRAAGINQFHVWTVDDPTVARFYANLGAWGITTNRPALIRPELT
jgi:glycerophosphoryl diester phosphodiesterase